MEKYMTLTTEKVPVKNFMFRSQSKRFPTKNFKPKDGPSPGAYSAKQHTPKAPSITSSFRSKTPRFSTSHTKVPGPGSYAKAFQHNPKAPSITSSFRSKTPRFSTSHTDIRKKIPGPGSYGIDYHRPIPKKKDKKGVQIGLFFNTD